MWCQILFSCIINEVSMSQKTLSFTITVHITTLRDLNSGYTVQITTNKHAVKNYTCVWFWRQLYCFFSWREVGPAEAKYSGSKCFLLSNLIPLQTFFSQWSHFRRIRQNKSVKKWGWKENESERCSMSHRTNNCKSKYQVGGDRSCNRLH